MPSCSEGSAHPFVVSSTDKAGASNPPTTHPTCDNPTTDLAELAELLADPGARAWTLAPTGAANEAVKVDSGLAGDLARRAGLDGPPPAWAVVARPRPDVVALDVDGYADLVLPELLHAAAETSTTVLARVASGRPNCAHLWLAPATAHGRAELLRTAAAIAEQHQLPAGAIDDRTGKAIRLPGSASLKPGVDRARLVDVDTGAPVAISHVLATVRSALPSHTPPASPARTTKGRKRRRRPPVEPTLPFDHSTTEPLITEAPRAWRRRIPLSAEEWAVLTDTRTKDRSAAATAAAWVLWRHGIRSASAALWWYQRCPAFTKFCERDEQATTRDWAACRRHWSAIATRARAHRPEAPDQEQKAIAAAREAVARWGDADLQAAALVIINRFDDGHGTTDRPIARRDLQLELHLSDGVATARLAALVEAGLLTVSAPWSASTPREATRYTLRIPQEGTYRGESAHDVTSPLSLLRHPLWGTLGHTARRLWEHLHTTPGPHTTRSLAHALQLPPGDRSHGLARVLHTLTTAGLVLPHGRGRGRSWALVAEASLDAAAERCGALDRARELAARIHAERACWHAESHAETRRARAGLSTLLGRLRHHDAYPTRRPSTARPPTPLRTALPRRRPPTHARPAQHTRDASPTPSGVLVDYAEQPILEGGPSRAGDTVRRASAHAHVDGAPTRSGSVSSEGGRRGNPRPRR